MILFFQGCAYRIITDYENCVSPKLTFEFEVDVKLCIIDDSQTERKYSSMNFPDEEYYLSTGNGCDGHGNVGIKYIPMHTQAFHLTGKYKVNRPKALLGAIISDTAALQADFNGTKVWISPQHLVYTDHKEYAENSIKALTEKSEFYNGWHLIFECPNTDVKEVGWMSRW